MGIYLLPCVHGNKCITIHDTFTTIMRDAGFHMGQEQLHALPSTTLLMS
jgi:hypothetical protein